MLEAAYNDALGVTAVFNRNMLLHVNRRAGADFDVRDWRHAARFVVGLSRIEAYLEAADDAHAMSQWEHGGGFSVDASLRIEAVDRARRERLLRYCARPALRKNSIPDSARPESVTRLLAGGGIIAT